MNRRARDLAEEADELRRRVEERADRGELERVGRAAQREEEREEVPRLLRLIGDSEGWLGQRKGVELTRLSELSGHGRLRRTTAGVNRARERESSAETRNGWGRGNVG